MTISDVQVQSVSVTIPDLLIQLKEELGLRDSQLKFRHGDGAGNREGDGNDEAWQVSSLMRQYRNYRRRIKGGPGHPKRSLMSGSSWKD